MQLMVLCCMLVNHLDDYRKQIDLHEESMSRLQHISYKVTVQETDANGTRAFGEATFTSAKNGTQIIQRDFLNKAQSNILLYPDKMIVKGGGSELLSNLTPRTPLAPIDCNGIVFRTFNWKVVEVLSLMEITKEPEVKLSSLQKDGKVIISYESEELQGTITLDLSRNSMASERTLSPKKGKHVGGKVSQIVQEWQEPEPGYFFPKKVLFQYFGPDGKLVRQTDNVITIMSFGNRVKDIEQWVKPSPNILFFDTIRKVQYRTRADGSPENQKPMIPFPATQTEPTQEVQGPNYRMYLIVGLSIIGLCLSVFVYRQVITKRALR